MTCSRRKILAALSAAATLPAVVAAPDAVQELIRRSETANAALMRGNIRTYRSFIQLTHDFTLMSPFGGTPSRSAGLSDKEWEAIGALFSNGTLRQELVEAYASPDMVVLAVIEHGYGEVGGLAAQPWPLRVTLVYQRHGDDWQLAHRHADPLVKGITLRQSAALAAGEPW